MQFLYSQALVLCFSKYNWPQLFQNILLIPWKSHTMYFIVFIPLPQLLLGMAFILCLSSDCLKYNQKVSGYSHNSCHYCASRHILPSRSLLQLAVFPAGWDWWIHSTFQHWNLTREVKPLRSVPAWFLHVCDSVCDVFSNRFFLSGSAHQEQWQ